MVDEGELPTVPVAAEALARVIGGAGELSPGVVLGGRYEIVAFIARGGMGAVYEAHDRELSIAVALKTLRADVGWNAAALDRFKRELQLARVITHPGVCRVFDLGRHGELVFLTMELLRGPTLAQRLTATGPFALADASPIVTQLADALGAAHAAGVIHRDLKPSNVILVEKQGRRRAVITDFGVAREISADAAAESQALPRRELGATGIAGTPDYMAPEQLAGEAITPAADVFALGVVIHELLTGALPYASATSVVAARDRGPARPRDLPAPWDAIVARCLAPDPGDRFGAAREVAAALAPRRSRRLVWAAGTAALAGVAATIMIARSAMTTIASTSEPRDAEARQAYDDGLRDVALGDPTTAAARMRAAIAREPEFPLAHAELAGVLLVLGDPLAARREAERASALSAGLDRQHALVVEARLGEATGAWDRAIERYEELIRIAPETIEYRWREAYAQLVGGKIPKADVTIAELHRRHAEAFRVDYLDTYRASRTDDWQGMLTAAGRLVASAGAAGAKRYVGIAWAERGNAFGNLGKAAEARTALDEAERQFTAIDDRSGLARVAFYRGALAGQSDFEGARTWFGRSLDLARAAGDQGGQARALVALGNWASNEHLDEAIEHYDAALAIYKATGDRSNVDTTLLNVANLHYKRGDHAKVHAALDEVLQSARSIGQPGTIAMGAINLALVTLSEADPARAQILIDEAAAAARTLGDPAIDGYVRWARVEAARARADAAAGILEADAIAAAAEAIRDPSPVEQARCGRARLTAGGDITGVCGAASEALEKAGASDDAVLVGWHAARGYLAKRDVAGARRAVERIEKLAKPSQDRHTHLVAALARAELDGDPQAIDAVARDATAVGALDLAFEARFASALARRAGHRDEALAAFATLEADAMARSMTGLAQRCRVARQR